MAKFPSLRSHEFAWNTLDSKNRPNNWMSDDVLICEWETGNKSSVFLFSACLIEQAELKKKNLKNTNKILSQVFLT